MRLCKVQWTRLGNIFSDHHAQVPVADELDNCIRLYYSSRIEGKSVPFFIDIDKENPAKILRREFHPILEHGRRGMFDWAGVMPTDIVTLDDVKYLYYIGWSVRQDVPYHNSLGLAISKDNGETWAKYSDGPILSSSQHEPGYVGTIDVRIDEQKNWFGWYLSCQEWQLHDNRFEPIYDIKLAKSRDGINWVPAGKTCIPLRDEEGGISAARVFKVSGEYIMYFSVRGRYDYRINPKNSYRIYSATSKDGIKWKREEGIEYDTSESEWENIMVCYPEVLTLRSGTRYMFYNGNGFGQTGIGCAVNV